MDSQNRCNSKQAASTTQGFKKSTLIGICLLLCILFAGVISVDITNSITNKPFDPRIENSNERVPNAMDPHYQGYVPHDAVIPTQEGIFVIDQKGRFKKVTNEATLPTAK